MGNFSNITLIAKAEYFEYIKLGLIVFAKNSINYGVADNRLFF